MRVGVVGGGCVMRVWDDDASEGANDLIGYFYGCLRGECGLLFTGGDLWVQCEDTLRLEWCTPEYYSNRLGDVHLDFTIRMAVGDSFLAVGVSEAGGNSPGLYLKWLYEVGDPRFDHDDVLLELWNVICCFDVFEGGV